MLCLATVKVNLNFASVVIAQLQINGEVYFVNEKEQHVVGYQHYFCLCHRSNFDVLEANLFIAIMLSLIVIFTLAIIAVNLKANR